MKTLHIDVDHIISQLHCNWDGNSYNGNFKRYLNSKKKYIINQIESELNKLNTCHKPIKIEFLRDERKVIVTYEWQETENINTWIEQIKHDLRLVTNYFWQQGINCYYS